MECDAQHLRGDKILQYAISTSLLTGERLRVLHADEKAVNLLSSFRDFAEIKGLGVGSEVCLFEPKKIAKKYELEGDVNAILQTIIPVIMFCGHQVRVDMKEQPKALPSSLYIKNVLLNHYSKYTEFLRFERNPVGSLTMILKGKYLLESAPLCVVKKHDELVAIRGEAHLDDYLFSFLELALKEQGYTLAFSQNSSQPSFVHLDALYGEDGNYDSEFAYVVYEEGYLEKQTDVADFAQAFKEKLRAQALSQELVEDLLFLISLVGGELPHTYEESDLLLEELNNLSIVRIRSSQGKYISSL